MVFNHVIAEQDGRAFKAHIEYPPNGAKGPGLILLHEVYGVNDSLIEVAKQYAQQGFVVMCPNMYWRMNPDASYRPQSPTEDLTEDLKQQRADSYKLMEGMDYNLVGPDMQTAIDDLRANPACTGKVGAMGVCLGGRCAFLAAAETDLDAGVALYATRFLNDLPKAADVSKPFIFVVPGKDPYVTREEKDALVDIAGASQVHVPGHHSYELEQTPAGNPNITTHVFPFQDHAFARIGGLHYEEAAANLAHRLATNHLKAALSAGAPNPATAPSIRQG